MRFVFLLALVAIACGDDGASSDVDDGVGDSDVISDTGVVDTAPVDTRPSNADQRSVVVRSVLVNARTTVIVAPGAELKVTLDFTIWSDPGCPECAAQLVFAVSDGSSVGCAYDGMPGPYPGVRDDGTVTLTAPSAPGTYDIRWKLDAAADCAAALVAYPGAPADVAQKSLEFLVQ